MSASDGGACDFCLARSWLLARLAGHLDRAGGRLAEVLALGDEQLIAAVAGKSAARVHGELLGFDANAARRRAEARGLDVICGCAEVFPARLRELETPPSVVYVAGRMQRFLELAAEECVAIVGARRATPYGLEVARSLGTELARAGVPIVSGLAFGVDSAAHAGALSVAGGTVAVLAGGADRPYPAAKASLHRQIRASGAAVSELAPDTSARRWMFPARNRIIAALAAMTVVVEAGEQSGALLTAGIARELGRQVGAVPGRITSPSAAGCNRLIADGAYVVAGAQDVLDRVFGQGARHVGSSGKVNRLEPGVRALLDALAAGYDTAEAFAVAGLSAEEGLAGLSELELGGHVQRTPGGRFIPSA